VCAVPYVRVSKTNTMLRFICDDCKSVRKLHLEEYEENDRQEVKA